MVLRNEYEETMRRFNRLPVGDQNKLLKKVTANHMTPELENDVINLRSIDGVGDVTARAILFALGILGLIYE